MTLKDIQWELYRVSWAKGEKKYDAVTLFNVCGSQAFGEKLSECSRLID